MSLKRAVRRKPLLWGWQTVLLLGWLALSGCTAPSRATPAEQLPTRTSVVQPAPADQISNPVQVSPSPISTDTDPDAPDVTTQPEAAAVPRPRYTLSAQFDPAAHSLAVEEAIQYWNGSTQALSELVLLVEANRYAGAFELRELQWQAGKAVQGYTLEGNRLVIPLPEQLPAGAEIELRLTYALKLPPIPEPGENVRPRPFGYTFRQTNLVDWYPYLPPYREGEGWLAHEPWYFGEHQVYDIADYEVRIRVAEADPRLVIAASALPEREGEDYVYHLEAARSFAWSASEYYTVISETVGAVTVLSYAFPFGLEGGEAALRHTVEALALYSELFGEYRHDSLSVVEADFLDGMEYDGLYFLSRGFYDLYDGSPKGYLTAIAVHETAHQWWYGLVGNDQALEPWLDEALCTYAERLYYERYYPELVDWWWYFRVNYYQPEGPINRTLYDYNGFRPYRDAVYLQGATFLEGLRQRVGDETFFAFWRDYAMRYALKLVSREDFFSTLEAHTESDVSDIVGEYFLP